MTTNIIKDLLPILKAYSEGKTIQYSTADITYWIDINDFKIIDIQNFMDKHYTYRIKPEPKYIPFETKEECWEEMLKHQPFSWVEFKDKQFKQPIVSVAENELMIDAYPDEHICYSFEEAFNSFLFTDGTPFGKLITE